MIGEIALWELKNKCKHLKFKFSGVYAADNFPLALDRNTFVIVNSDKAEAPGTHWLLYCNREVFAFGDPLGLPLSHYEEIYKRLQFTKFTVTELVKHQLQKPTSNLCGLYCLYIAHYVFSSHFPMIPTISEVELLRFVKHTLYFCCFYLFFENKSCIVNFFSKSIRS